MTVSGFCITSFQLAGLWSRRGGGSWHAFSVPSYFNNFRPGSHWVCRLYHKQVSRSKRYLWQKRASRDAKLLPIWPSYIHSLLYKKKWANLSWRRVEMAVLMSISFDFAVLFFRSETVGLLSASFKRERKHTRQQSLAECEECFWR